ncbi:Uncharacterised protein [Mycobacterium tuberculosis]|nr:Uncharacterised protein [Mycobacterium tuberculosis]
MRVVPTNFGAADRRHRRDQRGHRDHVASLQHRTPAGGRAVGVAAQLGQHATTLDQLARENGQLGQVVDGRAVADVGGGLVEGGQRRGGVQVHHRYRPRQQHRIGSRGRARGEPDQLRRVQRRRSQRRQQQNGGCGFARMYAGDQVSGRRERVWPRGAQRLTRALHQQIGVLRPQPHPAGVGPEAVQNQHAVLLSCRRSGRHVSRFSCVDCGAATSTDRSGWSSWIGAVTRELVGGVQKGRDIQKGCLT